MEVMLDATQRAHEHVFTLPNSSQTMFMCILSVRCIPLTINNTSQSPFEVLQAFHLYDFARETRLQQRNGCTYLRCHFHL